MMWRQLTDVRLEALQGLYDARANVSYHEGRHRAGILQKMVNIDLWIPSLIFPFPFPLLSIAAAGMIGREGCGCECARWRISENSEQVAR